MRQRGSNRLPRVPLWLWARFGPHTGRWVVHEISEREIEIIELVAEGLTNQEIAERLTISKRTVDNHVSNIFTKTGAKNRVALLNWAMDNGKICRDGFNCCSLDGRD